jgi:hypothetical protein
MRNCDDDEITVVQSIQDGVGKSSQQASPDSGSDFNSGGWRLQNAGTKPSGLASQILSEAR